VVGRVEVGGDVFDVPAQTGGAGRRGAGGDVGVGEGDAVAEDFDRGDAEGFQGLELGGRAVLVEDELEIVPRGLRRQGEQEGEEDEGAQVSARA